MVKSLSRTIILIVIAICMIASFGFFVPNQAMAADLLDTEDVVEIRECSFDTYWAETPLGDSIEEEPVKEGDKIYVKELIDMYIFANGFGTCCIQFYRCNTEFGERYIYAALTRDYNEPVKVKRHKGSTSNESIELVNVADTDSEGRVKHTKTVRITAYCKACNGGGGTQTASGVPAYVGGCAVKGIPFGTVVHTSYGDFTVIDRPGGSSILDIYIGDYDHCHCSGAGYSGKETVWWYE